MPARTREDPVRRSIVALHRPPDPDQSREELARLDRREARRHSGGRGDDESDRRFLGRRLAVLDPVGQDPQSKGLGPAKSILAGSPIDHASRDLRDLGDPAPVFLAVELDSQRHPPILRGVPRRPEGTHDPGVSLRSERNAAASVAMAVRGEVGRQLREADQLVPLVYRGADGEEYDRPDLPHVEPADRLMEQAAARAAAALPEIERRVVALRFGLEDGEPLTLGEVGRRVGLSRQRVAQLEAQAIGRLRKLLVPRRPRGRKARNRDASAPGWRQALGALATESP